MSLSFHISEWSIIQNLYSLGNVGKKIGKNFGIPVSTKKDGNLSITGDIGVLQSVEFQFLPLIFLTIFMKYMRCLPPPTGNGTCFLVSSAVYIFCFSETTYQHAHTEKIER